MRALLGGWNAWLNAGGATEHMNAPSSAPPSRMTDEQIIASPNPVVSEEDATKGGTTGKVSATPIQATGATQSAPMKNTTKSKTKAKRKSSKTRTE
ncbi:MAG: hypothetical protein LC754_16955 [Acidobacteria bacterium]|nr:hypothetical protein [Acidobacteriota bacterium]